MTEINDPFVTDAKKAGSGIVDPFLSANEEPSSKSAAESAARIMAAPVQRRQFDTSSVGGFLKSAPGAIAESFTGRDRQTEATRKLPEIGSELGISELLGPGLSPAKKAAITATLITTFDPVEFVKIIEANATEPVGVQSDEKGNVILAVGDRKGILNAPGLSAQDVGRLIGTAAEFTPAGAVRQQGIKSVARVGLRTAATETANQSAQKAAGGDFNATDIGLAGGSGAAFQGLVQALARRFPIFRQADEFTTSRTVREDVRQEAIRLGFSPDEVTDDFIDSVLTDVRGATSPDQAMAIAGEREFRIPLTQGQRTLDDAALSFEDSARSGMLGDQPRRTIRAFEDQQRQAVDNAVEQVQSGLSGGRTLATGRAQAGEQVISGVRAAERVADDAVQAAYGEVGAAALDREGVSALARATRRAVMTIDADRRLPETAKILSDIDEILRAQRLPNVRPTDLRRLELMRRRIGTAIQSAERADARQLRTMQRAFDDYIDNAVINDLFSGDDKALSNLRQARGLFREYAQRFRANPDKTGSNKLVRDTAGDFIEKIVDSDPTPEQAINAVFGAGDFSNASGVNLARRFRDILGAESDGWQALRQAAFLRLLKTNSVNGRDVVSGQRSLVALNKAVENNGTLLREIFSPGELSQIRRLFATIQRTTATAARSRENPSGTAQKLAAGIRQAASRLGGILGGDLTLLVTGTSTEIANGIRNTSRTLNAIRPFEQVIRPKPGIVGGAVAVTQDAAN